MAVGRAKSVAVSVPASYSRFPNRASGEDLYRFLLAYELGELAMRNHAANDTRLADQLNALNLSWDRLMGGEKVTSSRQTVIQVARR